MNNDKEDKPKWLTYLYEEYLTKEDITEIIEKCEKDRLNLVERKNYHKNHIHLVN